MLGDHLGQADHGDVHVELLQALLELGAAGGAHGHHALRGDLLDLGLLPLEGRHLEFRRALVAAHAAAGATAPLVAAVFLEIDEVVRDQIHEIALLLDDAALAGQVAGVMQGQAIHLLALGLDPPRGAQFVQNLDDVEDPEGIGFADQVGALPPYRRVGMTALGTYDILDLELNRRIHDALHQGGGYVLVADLDTGIGGLVAIGAQGPVDARMVEDLGDGLQVLGKVDDLHGREQDQVIGPLDIDGHLEPGAGLHMVDLDLQGLPLEPHGAARAHGAGGGGDETLGGVARGHHALARLADHVLDVVAHRADHGAAGAHGAGVIEEGLPLLQHLVGDLLVEAKQTLDPAEEGKFRLPHPAQGLQLFDGGVLRVPGLDVEETGLGAETAVDATRKEGRDGRVDLGAQGIEAPFQ